MREVNTVRFQSRSINLCPFKSNTKQSKESNTDERNKSGGGVLTCCLEWSGDKKGGLLGVTELNNGTAGALDLSRLFWFHRPAPLFFSFSPEEDYNMSL